MHPSASAAPNQSQNRPKSAVGETSGGTDEPEMSTLEPTPPKQPASSGQTRSLQNPWLFECAWEVANRVGGIYTVLRTKAPVTVAEYGKNYVMMGPLNAASVALEVEILDPATVSPTLASALDAMTSRGVSTTFGRWLIDGAPLVLLFDLSSRACDVLGAWITDLAKDCHIAVPAHDHDAKQAVALGFLVTWFLGEFSHRHTTSPIIAHFHEWQAGVALALIKARKMDSIATLFTTHATLLGRYICASKPALAPNYLAATGARRSRNASSGPGHEDFYSGLPHYNVDAEAGRRAIYHRYCIERAAAHCAHVFTTVSHITAYEAEHLLKRRPDGVVPNGLSLVRYPAMHEFQNLHAVAKEKIHDFVRGHFFGHLDFDLDNTLYFFTAGRYEFRNKGIDVFLEALARLNHRLRVAKSKMTVVAFIIMPAATHSINVEALRGQAVTKQLKDTVHDIQQAIGRRLFRCAAQFSASSTSGGSADEDGIASALRLLPEEGVALKRKMYALRRTQLPLVVTHHMADDGADPVLCTIRRVRLFNHSHDRVKIIFHPEFLSSGSPLIGLEYDEFVRGCHLGVFPSYYEPWGYTPAECTVMGVPSVTTNLSGFGGYIAETVESPHEHGVFIIDRRFRGVDDSTEQLVDRLEWFCRRTRRQRIALRNRTERLSDFLDWKRMGLEYVKARHLALRRTYPTLFKSRSNDSKTPATATATATAPRASSDGAFDSETQALSDASALSPVSLRSMTTVGGTAPSGLMATSSRSSNSSIQQQQHHDKHREERLTAFFRKMDLDTKSNSVGVNNLPLEMDGTGEAKDDICDIDNDDDIVNNADDDIDIDEDEDEEQEEAERDAAARAKNASA